jgi:transcriptional regulator with XRE-family HTH domain
MGLGTKIKKIRELKNFSQDFMAQQLEMSQSGYSKIERDEVSISYDKVEKIAELLQVSMGTLVEFDERVLFQNNTIQNNVVYQQAPINFYGDLKDRVEELEKTIQSLAKKI